MLEKSTQNQNKSRQNLKQAKTLFSQTAKKWQDEFTKEFEARLETQNQSKSGIKDFTEEIRKQRVKIAETLEHPAKAKLVTCYDDLVKDTNNVLVKQDQVKMSTEIDPEDIENNFIPSFVSHE